MYFTYEILSNIRHGKARILGSSMPDFSFRCFHQRSYCYTRSTSRYLVVAGKLRNVHEVLTVSTVSSGEAPKRVVTVVLGDC